MTKWGTAKTPFKVGLKLNDTRNLAKPNFGYFMENINETYNRRLEEKLDLVLLDVKQLSREVLVLTTINESQKHVAENVAKKLEVVESDVQFTKGAIGLLKIILGIGGGALITSFVSFGVWIVSTNTATQQRIADSNQRVAVIETQLTRIDTDIKSMPLRVRYLSEEKLDEKTTH